MFDSESIININHIQGMDDICYRPTLQQVQLFEFMAYQYDYRTMPTTNKEIYVCVELCGEIEKIFHFKTYTVLYVI